MMQSGETYCDLGGTMPAKQKMCSQALKLNTAPSFKYTEYNLKKIHRKKQSKYKLVYRLQTAKSFVVALVLAVRPS